MAKTHITRTLGPIHFEDLEPHRFEDLVSELIYDFKAWQSIEATGRNGNDDGIDIRAFEKNLLNDDIINDEDKEDILLPMEGNLWIVQCKREKEIGPKKVEKIITESINPSQIPYGYILVASANFSKKSYDIFRDELRKRGIMEYYLWGKAELEHMLYLPKFDRVLFTFFGISLITQKKFLTTEIRFGVNNKNKLVRILGGDFNPNHPVLIRDLNNDNYPYKEECINFEKSPRWFKGIVVQYTPVGIVIKLHEYFAFIDKEKKQWDYTTYVDNDSFINYELNDKDEKMQANDEKEQLVKDYCDYFESKNQAKLEIYAVLKFQEISFIDEKGDVLNEFPHIYTTFYFQHGPFKKLIYLIEKDGEHIDVVKTEYNQILKFPESFPQKTLGNVYYDKTISIDNDLIRIIKLGRQDFLQLFDTDGKYHFLNPKDVIVAQGLNDREKSFIKITNKKSYKMKDYALQVNDYFLKERISQQIGRELNDEEILNVYEFKIIYEWEIERIIKPNSYDN